MVEMIKLETKIDRLEKRIMQQDEEIKRLQKKTRKNSLLIFSLLCNGEINSYYVQIF